MFIFASTNSDQVVLRAVGAPPSKIQMESSKNNPVPRAFSLAWGRSENYVNLAFAGFFAVKIKRFAPSDLTDTVKLMPAAYSQLCRNCLMQNYFT